MIFCLDASEAIVLFNIGRFLIRAKVAPSSSSAVQPALEATIAASTSLASNQFFDVTGFVQEDFRLKRMQDVV